MKDFKLKNGSTISFSDSTNDPYVGLEKKKYILAPKSHSKSKYVEMMADAHEKAGLKVHLPKPTK